MSDYFKSQEFANEELRKIDLTLVTQEIEQYNQQFGMGRMMSRAILQGIHSESEERADLSEEGQKESQKTFLERINKTYGIYLEKSGVSLESVGGSSAVFMNNEQIETSLLRINLADRNRFLEYISALDPKTVSLSQIEGLKIVLSSLTEQLKKEYDVEKLDPRAVELIGGLEQIITGCQRLDPNNEKGLADESKKLAMYMEAAKGGYIKEYILTGRTSALAKVGEGFGPSTWQIDSNEESYQRSWNRALDLLTTVKKNPRAAILVFEITENLRQSAEFARKDINTLAEKNPQFWTESRKENYLKILEGALAKLKPAVRN
jgi:hypothetical protein